MEKHASIKNIENIKINLFHQQFKKLKCSKHVKEVLRHMQDKHLKKAAYDMCVKKFVRHHFSKITK